jgi:geranylgeranyl diphosphate synthase type I
MPLSAFYSMFLPAIEKSLKEAASLVDGESYPDLQAMMAYHLGWEGENAGPEATGKRIRPLLVLLTCSAAEGNWEWALPAAAAVELIHNFSLLHDDIEDHSPLRRGRPTVWARWGIPQAINTGDAMFALAHLVLLQLEKTTSAPTTLQAVRILLQTCLDLTQGQHLDISYEKREGLEIEDYWRMVEGKTAALLSACTELGALTAGARQEKQQHYRVFGFNLGLAFQALDDILGIWGDAEKIGKSNASDLVTGKKTLPVLYGLKNNQAFASRWKEGEITFDEVPSIARQLEAEGARTYTQGQANLLTQKALDAFTAAQPQGAAGEALQELANMLLQREQ